ncbi:MAG: peptidyl-prolyl cis-trans isomerase [Elusimicrobiota bacterium]
MKNPLLTLVILALTAPSARGAEPDREIVKVNGTPIRQSEVLERLWKRYGPATLDEMVDELLLRQAASAQKIKAEPADVDRKYESIKKQFGDPVIFENQLQQAGTSPEKLKLEIADQLALDKLVAGAKKLAVKDEDVKKAFDAHKASLAAPAAVHLKHILVKTETEAKDIIDKVKAGSAFSKLAEERSLAPTGKLKGGDYGFVSRGMLPAEIEDIAFAMKPGEMKTIDSPKGLHILQVVEKREPKPAVFAQVKDDLKDMLLSEKIKAALPAFIQELRQKAEIKPQGEAN